MIIDQIYTGCLAQGAYYIQSDNEAIIIDPLRDTKAYIDKANENGAAIKYILETHFHADFVSGHVALSKATGAPIVYGPNADPEFEFHAAQHGEILAFGSCSIEVLHTPGHTMESTCYLLRDHEQKPHAVFTGDTLFIGDVGRPDLAQKAESMTQEQLAGHLFHSLRNHLMTLPTNVLVYPAHGAGSACGKNLSSKTWDTIGGQLESNYALRADMTEGEFVTEVTDGLLPPPAYFPENVALNKRDIPSLDDILIAGTKALNPQHFEVAAEENHAVILDTRSPGDFVAGHIPGSIFIGIDGGFAPWVGALIADTDQAIAVVTPIGREEEVVTRLARVGFDRVVGFLEGGIESWKSAGKEIDSIEQVTAEQFSEIWKHEKPKLLDVRKNGEFAAEHIDGAVNLPLDFINQQMERIDSDETYYAHCLGGYRSVIFNSILKSRGCHQVIDIAGGWKELLETDLPKTDYVCPSTLN